MLTTLPAEVLDGGREGYIVSGCGVADGATRGSDDSLAIWDGRADCQGTHSRSSPAEVLRGGPTWTRSARRSGRKAREPFKGISTGKRPASEEIQPQKRFCSR